MQALDFAKAAGLAAAILIVDVLVAVGVVYLWADYVAPGHPRAYYATAGVAVARLSTRIFGTALVLAALWWAGRRNPQRNPLLFAVIVVICYAVLDGASVGFAGFLSASFGFTTLLKLLAGLAGAQLARMTRPRATT